MNQALPLLAARQPIDGSGLQFGIDWFAFTVKGAQRVWVVSQLVELLGDEWRDWQLVRRSERRERTRGPHGALMEVDWAEKWVHVVIKGKGCRAVGTEAIVRLHEVLFAKVGDAYRAKRVDLAWDDYKKRVSPEQFRERFCDPVTKKKRPEVVCKARGGRAIVDDAPNGGGSYTIGRRESNRLLRVYDKAAESGGTVDAIRIELECKDRVAVDVMEALVRGSVECRSAAVVGFLVGFIDFREAVPGMAVRQRPRCSWWAELVGAARKAKLSPVERLGLEEWRMDFTQRNSSGFRLLCHLNGGDIGQTSQELLGANLRDNPRHRAWHRQIKAERLAREAECHKTGDGGGSPS